jgi:hypothetical protein
VQARARERELVQALAELKAEEAESQAGIPGLVAERDECRYALGCVEQRRCSHLPDSQLKQNQHWRH